MKMTSGRTTETTSGATLPVHSADICFLFFCFPACYGVHTHLDLSTMWHHAYTLWRGLILHPSSATLRFLRGPSYDMLSSLKFDTDRVSALGERLSAWYLQTKRGGPGLQRSVPVRPGAGFQVSNHRSSSSSGGGNPARTAQPSARWAGDTGRVWGAFGGNLTAPRTRVCSTVSMLVTEACEFVVACAECHTRDFGLMCWMCTQVLV